MSTSESSVGSDPMTQSEIHSVLFVQLVMQQSNLAMMLMGKVPHPDSGKQVKDLESARFFIDQLEMLEAKTKGNLSKEEDAMLKQTLMTLRMAYVEAVNGEEAGAASTSASAKPEPSKPEEKTSAPSTTAPASEEEHRPKFTKKY